MGTTTIETAKSKLLKNSIHFSGKSEVSSINLLVSVYLARDIMKDNYGNNFLNILIGEKLSSVTFVMDYLQLDFDGNRFTLNIWPVITVGGKEYKFGEPTYRDSLCSLITKIVKQVGGESSILYWTLKVVTHSLCRLTQTIQS